MDTPRRAGVEGIPEGEPESVDAIPGRREVPRETPNPDGSDVPRENPPSGEPQDVERPDPAGGEPESVEG